MTQSAISLYELSRRITNAIAVAPDLQGVWITAETSDVRTSGGHCYMELLQKDEKTGAPVARCRAAIWASAFARIGARFTATTGAPLRSDMKIMARVNVGHHAVYGLSLIITDINPDYTVGDLARRRNEIIRRLQAEGVFDLNRTLPWPDVPARIAVISARGAAGYGDFVKQLHGNPARLRFATTLFEATLQGERTAPSVIAALEAVMERIDNFDCVVIIRGGGAVSDLASFDDYSLASHIAQFPIPVIAGIGHERDITVLDYVANTRVKTPTAAAEVLIKRCLDAYDRIRAIGAEILQTVTAKISAERQQLAYCRGLLPALARNVIEKNRRRTGPEIPAAIASAVRSHLARSRDRLASMSLLLDTLTPEATMRRGYSITRINGHAITDSSDLTQGITITTTFAKGPDITSTITQTTTQNG